MHIRSLPIVVLSSVCAIGAVTSARCQDSTGGWTVTQHKGYKVLSRNMDEKTGKDYTGLFDNGIRAVERFFGDSFKTEFTVAVHPDRQSLDRQWQQDWKMPEFKSECWMVASGVAHRLDVLSPQRWDTGSCEHTYSDKPKTQQVITHELFHVYHGQVNASPDFSDVEGLDCFAEGFATYAAGQCDSMRLAEVKNELSKGTIPHTLDKFWTGKLRYGLSGSVISFIDHRYARQKLKELLRYNKKRQVMDSLRTTEDALR